MPKTQKLGQQLGIRLVNLNITDPISNPGADLEVDFDNVRINAFAVPEPNSVFFVVSIAGLTLIRKRRMTK